MEGGRGLSGIKHGSLSKSTKKSTLGADPLSFNTRSRFPMATTRVT